MKFHIIKNGETLKDILFIYALNEDELKECNRHIRSWKALIPGTKIKIPVIPESVDQDVMEMEPFIEDYYPQNKEHYEYNILEEDIKEEAVELQDNIVNEETIVNISEDCSQNELEVIKDEEEIIKEEKEERNTTYYKTRRNVNYIYYYPYFHPYYGYIMVPYKIKK